MVGSTQTGRFNPGRTPPEKRVALKGRQIKGKLNTHWRTSNFAAMPFEYEQDSNRRLG